MPSLSPSIPESTAPADNIVSLRLWLALILFTAYGLFMVLIGFAKPMIAMKIVPGLSVGILFGAAIIALCWTLTAIYIARVEGDCGRAS